MEDRDQVLAVAALGDDTRRALYRFVRVAGRPVTREEAARGVRVSIKLAAFHLDKLVERRLLQIGRPTPTGVLRRVGRAPKTYAVSDLQVSVTLPPRRYDLAGEILVDTLLRAETEPGPLGELARQTAWQRGYTMGVGAGSARQGARLGPERAIAQAQAWLDDHGYEPAEDLEGGLTLRNCPFHGLVDRAPELVCGLNAALIDGMLRGLGNQTVRAELRPAPGRCCVRIGGPRPQP
jgi:predicted ArsR family transcriptional regulator